MVHGGDEGVIIYKQRDSPQPLCRALSNQIPTYITTLPLPALICCHPPCAALRCIHRSRDEERDDQRLTCLFSVSCRVARLHCISERARIISDETMVKQEDYSPALGSTRARPRTMRHTIYRCTVTDGARNSGKTRSVIWIKSTPQAHGGGDAPNPIVYSSDIDCVGRCSPVDADDAFFKRAVEV